jgi:ribose transport system substrate-binding protein
VTRPKKLRFGFGGQSVDMPFSVEVTESLKSAAASVGVDLMILDNCYDAATALRNAEEFVKNRVDLVIEFQIEQEAAPVIADKIAAAKIPLIAIDIPHPHATYFGVDNYRVGYEAGEVLAAHALKLWDGKVDWVLGLDLPEAGTAGAEPHYRSFRRACAAAFPTCPSSALCASTDAACANAAAS